MVALTGVEPVSTTGPSACNHDVSCADYSAKVRTAGMARTRWPPFRLRAASVSPARPAFREASSSGEFLFEPVDFAAEPLFDCLLTLAWIQVGDRSTFLIERNVVTRNVFGLAGLWNVLHEDALIARMTPKWITEIQAGERILERRCGFVWRTN